MFCYLAILRYGGEGRGGEGKEGGSREGREEGKGGEEKEVERRGGGGERCRVCTHKYMNNVCPPGLSCVLLESHYTLYYYDTCYIIIPTELPRTDSMQRGASRARLAPLLQPTDTHLTE